ncbi:hypothetical protein M405DRAFT_560923 [Rhizopogon salebrosus TDB-379]|nr:hypothetical protein M405DRAFT_560923 [Rhizopogon salebrosus TDB-379]
MSLDIIHVAPETVVVYECKLQENPCALLVEGTTTAISAHLRSVHGITGPENANTNCTWSTCSRTLQRGSMTRHILTTHLGVKARCSTCGVIMCRRDLIRAHIRSSEACHSAFADVVHGPEGRALTAAGFTAAA